MEPKKMLYTDLSAGSMVATVGHKGVDEEDAELQEELSGEADDGSEAEDAPPRPAWKPDIAHLPDAVQVVDGVRTLMVAVGDRIVIDYSALKYGAWLDTRSWIVDQIRDDGYMGLRDPQQDRKSCTDWITGPARGLVIKVPRRKEDWSFTGSMMSRKKAARATERALKAEKTDIIKQEKESVRESQGLPKGTGKGRPKGTLNARTKERLKAAGHDYTKMTKAQVDEVMAKIRKDDYEKAKADRKSARAAAAK